MTKWFYGLVITPTAVEECENCRVFSSRRQPWTWASFVLEDRERERKREKVERKCFILHSKLYYTAHVAENNNEVRGYETRLSDCVRRKMIAKRGAWFSTAQTETSLLKSTFLTAAAALPDSTCFTLSKIKFRCIKKAHSDDGEEKRTFSQVHSLGSARVYFLFFLGVVLIKCSKSLTMTHLVKLIYENF